MKKPQQVETFGQQMANSMAELRAIMDQRQSPTRDGQLTVRIIEVAEPGRYSADDVKAARAALNVSQAVFARLIGVSDVLVCSWERGVREPAPVARRLLDVIQHNPSEFSRLVRRVTTKPVGDSKGSGGDSKGSGVIDLDNST